MRCPTTSGRYQCARDLNADGSPHAGECECQADDIAPSVFREAMRKAAQVPEPKEPKP